MEATVKTVAENSEKVKYRRRLDRSPSNDFDRLPREEKIKVSKLREGLEKAKNRSQRLREENEAKDIIIEDERQQRKIVEERLQKFLVDVYNNPNINSELRERLPRAKSYDPLHVSDVKNFDLDVKENVEPSNTEPFNGNAVEKSIDPSFQGSVHNAAKSDHKPDATGIGQTTGVYESPIQAHAVTMNQHSSLARSTESLPQSHLDGFAYPNFPPHTASFSSINTALSSSYLDLPQTGPARDKGPTIQKESHIEPHLVSGLNNELPSKDLPTSVNDQKNYPENIPTANTQFLLHPMPVNAVNYHYSQPYHPPADNVSHMTRFLAEISTLKKENQDLKNELEEKKHDFEMFKEDLQQAKSDEDKDDSVAALIEMVHSAGKKREQALSQMVSSAVQDRDATLGELDRLRLRTADKSLHTASFSNIDCSDHEEIEENFAASRTVSDESMPGNLTETLGSDTELSLDELKNLISRQREIMQEDMKEVLQQRDQALMKVARLEKKLSSFEVSEFSYDSIESLKAKLRITETERDIAISKLRKISEDFGEMKLLNNLRQALVHDAANSDLNLKQSEKNKQIDSDKWDPVKNNNMVASINKQVEENNKLEKKIVLLEYQNKEQSQHIEKLQALIKRQRQKLNALCAGPLLIED